MEIGAVVLSRRGRDKGHYFVCVKVPGESEILIADGELHKLKKPKKKNIKHVKPNGAMLEKVKEKLNAGKKVFDSEIRKGLRPFNEKTEEKECQKMTQSKPKA